MEFGLNFEKLLLIGVIAVLLVGPDRLPKYAEAFARLVRRAGEMLRDTKSRVRDEMGPEIDDVDWRRLDPRQYDPRRIIRDALFEEPSGASSVAPPVVKAPTAKMPSTSSPTAASILEAAAAPSQAKSASSGLRPEFTRTSPPPFDPEST